MPFSCFLFRPRKSREKRRKRSHINASNASVIRTSRVSQTPLQTPIPYFHQWVKLVLAQSSAKRPTFAFTGESGYTLAFTNRIAHSGLHAETGNVSDGALSLPSTRAARSRTSPGRVSERQTLPLLGLGREVLSKNAESLRNSDALMRVAVPRRRGPAGLRNLFSFLSKLRFSHSVLKAFRVRET